MTNAHIKFVLLMVGAVPMSLYGLYSLVHGSYLLAVVVLGAAVFWAAWSVRILRAGKTPTRPDRRNRDRRGHTDGIGR